MKSENPFSIAMRWIDAYRASSLEKLMQLYDSNATHICACGGQKLVAGSGALRAYWAERFEKYPVKEVLNVEPGGEAEVSIRYRTETDDVLAKLILDGKGKITHILCGPKDAQFRH